MVTGAHILIVDDSGKIHAPLCELLWKRGYRVTMVVDGSGMRRCVDSDAPELVILDLVLMRDGGLGLCRGLRARFGIPVIMLTVPDDECARIAGLEAGATDCLSRPFNPAELLARIGAVLRRTRKRPDDVHPTHARKVPA